MTDEFMLREIRATHLLINLINLINILDYIILFKSITHRYSLSIYIYSIYIPIICKIFKRAFATRHGFQ